MTIQVKSDILNVIVLGHLNDAHVFAIMRSIIKDIPFPDECVLLGDTICSNRHPIVTQIFRPNCGKGTVDGSVES